MRFVVFLLFLSIQIIHASGPEEIDVTVKGIRLSDGRVLINTDTTSCDGLLFTSNGMRKVALNVTLTTCPVDTTEGGVLRIRGGRTLNDVLGGFAVGTKPCFEDLVPMPYENLFSLLLTGSETISVEFNDNILNGIKRAKGYLRALSRQEARCPIRFFRNALEDCLADEFDGIAPADQLKQLAQIGPQIIGLATTLSAYLNHLLRGETLETFEIPETSDGLVRCFMKMALPTEYQADPRYHTILSTYFDLLIGHGMNLSTSTLIQTASGSGDVMNAISAAFNALDTDNHGKAALKVHEMLKDVSVTYEGEAPRFIDAVIKKEETLWGHGHAIYKKGTDPRAEVMEVLVRKVRVITTDIDLQHDIDLALVLKAEAFAKGLPYQTNVDYFASLVLKGCGINPNLSTVMFAASRIGSWMADLYQFGKEKRALMRPQDYPVERNPLLQEE